MAYTLFIERQAQRKLQSLSRIERVRIVERIQRLGANPDDAGLDIKRLAGQPFYRLRGGHWRVVYDRKDQLRIIAIVRIKARGDVYK